MGRLHAFCCLTLSLLGIHAFAGFMSVDPKRQYHNPYSYAGNNPINRIDPDGRLDTTALDGNPVQIKIARLVELYGKQSQTIRNQIKTLTPSTMHSRLTEALTPGSGFPVTPDLNLVGARARYKNGKIDTFPLDKNRAVSLASVTAEAATFFHEIVHGVKDETVHTTFEQTFLKFKNGGLTQVTGQADIGTFFESEFFGFDVNTDSAEFLIQNRSKFESEFSRFFEFVDFISSQTNLKPGELVPIDTFKEQIQAK